VDEPLALGYTTAGRYGRTGGGIRFRGRRINVLSSLACCKRLTAPGAVTQDTEKTAVFLYSKVK
jgi:hypothetical protein